MDFRICFFSTILFLIPSHQQDRIFTCFLCNEYIGKQSDVFPMSKEGPQSAYCNPAGVIHETVTLYKARGLVLSREAPCAEYSWFPGYCCPQS